MKDIYAPKYWPSWLTAIPLGLSLVFGKPYVARLGRFVGNIYHDKNNKRRHIVLSNLKVCFPDKSDDERAELCRSFYHRFGQGFINLGCVWWASDQRFNQMVECPRIDILNELKQRNKTVIFQIPHNVATDVGGIYLSQFFDMCSIGKKLDNPVLDYFTVRSRIRFGGTLYYRHQGFRDILQRLNNGQWLSLVADEDLGAESAVFSPFFNHPKATLTTTVRLAKSTGAIVVPCATQFDVERYKYIVHIGEPYEVPKSMPTEDAVALFNQRAEEMVNIDRSQFLWIFRWFKTGVDGNPSGIYD